MVGSVSRNNLQQANRDVFVTVQLETVELLAELDEVLKLPGLDSLVLGPQDLSGSMGRLGEITHPEVIDAMKSVASKTRAAGKFIGAGLGAQSRICPGVDRLRRPVVTGRKRLRIHDPGV